MEKVIVITGGSDGLGKEIATHFAKDNQVIILSKNEAKLKQVSDELNCAYYLCDVTNSKQVEETIKEIIEKYFKIDVLINNAGLWLEGNVEENSYEEISNCIDVNTKGSIYLTKAVLPYMNEQKSGLILNVCSQASFDEDSFSPVYNASKWAVRAFNRCIQKYVTKNGVKVTGFYPGFMNTDLFKKAGDDYDMSIALDLEKVVKAIEFIINQEENVIIPELGIKDIRDY